jgi:hypothetical protein
MPQYGYVPLATQVGYEACQRSYLCFGGGNPIQIAHEGDAHTVCVVPLAVCAHALQRARCMHAAVSQNHEVIRDIRVAPPLHATA